jgi:hypothetical protein
MFRSLTISISARSLDSTVSIIKANGKNICRSSQKVSSTHVQLTPNLKGWLHQLVQPIVITRMQDTKCHFSPPPGDEQVMLETRRGLDS